MFNFIFTTLFGKSNARFVGRRRKRTTIIRSILIWMIIVKHNKYKKGITAFPAA